MYVGIDVSKARGCEVCALDESRRVAVLAKARDAAALPILLRGLPREAAVAVDAPPPPPKGPGSGRRAAEAALLSLGISVPGPSEERAREAAAVYRLLEDLGFGLFLEGRAETGVAIECCPHLTYLSLTGSHRGRTSKLEWSRAALRGRVTGLPAHAEQDSLDAACAAITAWHFARGEWVGFGDPSEGVIVAPRTSHDLGTLRRDERQTALPILGWEAQPARPMRPATFPERVLRAAAQIPPGKVATYGDLARWAGRPAGARAVGTIIARHAFEVPAHRVVDAAGHPASFPEDTGPRLRAEGVPFDGSRVDLEAARWAGPL